MINEIFNLMEKENQERIKQFGESWSFTRRIKDIDDFMHYILEYFNFKEGDIKEEYTFDTFGYSRQTHIKFNYIELLLERIKPMLKLAYKLSMLGDTSEMFEKGKISEDAIVNMIDNFLNLNRSGRPRKIYPETLKQFQEFKQKYSNILNFLRELKKPEIKSINDYAAMIMQFKITLNQLKQYKNDYTLKFKQYVDRASTKTLYRYDKDFIFVKHSIYTVEIIEDHWSIYPLMDNKK